MRIGIVGAGLQARRRAPALREFPGMEIRVVSAAHRDHAAVLASRLECEAEEGWEPVVARGDLDAVIVCTPPDLHAEISIAALESGKHVLCEKPLARTAIEARRMIEAARRSGRILKCGFNHRYHPGVRTVRQWVDAGAVGDILYMRCRYGICGRPEYEREWRADERVVSGGQLMEQGIHAVDLFRWFLGDPAETFAYVETAYWDIAPLEDNAFMLMRWGRGQVASLHSSLTQWKNQFSFEVFGRDGYGIVEGLGGGYGNERAVLGKRDFHAPFTEQVVEYRGDDRSWNEEWRVFLEMVTGDRDPLESALDGLRALELVQDAYTSARERRPVRVASDLS